MNIDRFIWSAVAADGGTTVCRVALSDGRDLEIGVDARIPKRKEDRLLFLGSYPTDPASRILARGSEQEKEVIDAIQKYLDMRCGFLRREALAGANLNDLPEEDHSDAIAVALMRIILDR